MVLGDVSRADRCLSVPQPRFTSKIINARQKGCKLWTTRKACKDLASVDHRTKGRAPVRDSQGCHACEMHGSCTSWKIAEKACRHGAVRTLDRKKTRMKGLALPARMPPRYGESLVLRGSRTGEDDLPNRRHLRYRARVLFLAEISAGKSSSPWTRNVRLTRG